MSALGKRGELREACKGVLSPRKNQAPTGRQRVAPGREPWGGVACAIEPRKGCRTLADCSFALSGAGGQMGVSMVPGLVFRPSRTGRASSLVPQLFPGMPNSWRFSAKGGLTRPVPMPGRLASAPRHISGFTVSVRGARSRPHRLLFGFVVAAQTISQGW